MSEDTVDKKALFNSMLDTQFADIEDLPDFITPVPGVYQLHVGKCEVAGLDSDSPYVKLVASLEAVVEQEGEEVEYPAGSMMSWRFYGDFGIKRFKKVFGGCFEGLGANTPAEFIDQVNGASLVAALTLRSDKDDKTVKYSEIKAAALA